MTRKRMLYIVSSLTIVAGLLWSWSFFSPLFDPNKTKTLNPVLIVVGISFLLSGWGLFKLSVFALETSFWLWFMSLIQNLLGLLFLLPTETGFADFKRLPILAFAFVSIVIELSVVIFLGQEKTKRMFAPETKEQPRTNISVEPKSNQ